MLIFRVFFSKKLVETSQDVLNVVLVQKGPYLIGWYLLSVQFPIRRNLKKLFLFSDGLNSLFVYVSYNKSTISRKSREQHYYYFYVIVIINPLSLVFAKYSIQFYYNCRALYIQCQFMPGKLITNSIKQIRNEAMTSTLCYGRSGLNFKTNLIIINQMLCCQGH